MVNWNSQQAFSFWSWCPSISWFYVTIWTECLIIQQHPSRSSDLVSSSVRYCSYWTALVQIFRYAPHFIFISLHIINTCHSETATMVTIEVIRVEAQLYKILFNAELLERQRNIWLSWHSKVLLKCTYCTCDDSWSCKCGAQVMKRFVTLFLTNETLQTSLFIVFQKTCSCAYQKRLQHTTESLKTLVLQQFVIWSREQRRKKQPGKEPKKKIKLSPLYCSFHLLTQHRNDNTAISVYTGQTQSRPYFENTLQLGLCNFTVERAPQIQFCGLEVAPEVCEWLFQTFGDGFLLKIPANSSAFVWTCVVFELKESNLKPLLLVIPLGDVGDKWQLCLLLSDMSDWCVM